MFKGVVYFKMTHNILAYVLACVQQLYRDYSQQVEEFMDMLHQTIRWKRLYTEI